VQFAIQKSDALSPPHKRHSRWRARLDWEGHSFQSGRDNQEDLQLQPVRNLFTNLAKAQECNPHIQRSQSPQKTILRRLNPPQSKVNYQFSFNTPGGTLTCPKPL
jgi:hypothetical protein